jgi:hypothetical protein
MLVHGADVHAEAEVVTGAFPRSVREGGSSWALDYHGGIPGEGARILAIDAPWYRREIVTIQYDRKRGFRPLPVLRVWACCIWDRQMTSPGDVDGDGIDDVAYTYSYHDEVQVALYPGRAGAVNVGGRDPSYEWLYVDDPPEPPELQVLTQSDRLHEDRTERQEAAAREAWLLDPGPDPL